MVTKGMMKWDKMPQLSLQVHICDHPISHAMPCQYKLMYKEEEPISLRGIREQMNSDYDILLNQTKVILMML